MRELVSVLLLILTFNTVFAQKTSVAVLPSEGTDASLAKTEEDALTDKMREAALNVLPSVTFILLNQDAVVKRLGGAENYIKECRESSCIVDLGKKAQVDYVAKAVVRKLGDKMMLNVELYRVSTSGLIGVFNGEADNAYDLIGLVSKNVPDVFRKIPGASKARIEAPSIAGGISGVQSGSGGPVDVSGRSYLVKFTTEPAEAILSFNGVPNSSCPRTPCAVVFPEGRIRIISVLDQYEISDTTVSITRNNQNVNIKMRANFGILEVKHADIDGIGSSDVWNLNINGKPMSSWKNKLSPGKYNVKIDHRCYEDISFDVGINKGSHEIFDMSKYINPKLGGLVLSAELDNQPVSEPVFVNGEQVGETPFSGAVPVCAQIEIGWKREEVNASVKYGKKSEHTHKMAASSIPSRFDKIKYGIGGTFYINYLDDINFGSADADTVGFGGFGGGLGMAISIPIVSKLTFNPEFYLVYRHIVNSSECYGCDLEISEFALNIPLIITLAWESMLEWGHFEPSGIGSDTSKVSFTEYFKINPYIEAGVFLGIPLSTSVYSDSKINFNRNKYDFGIILGVGYQLGDFSLGFRGNISTTHFDRNIEGSLGFVGIIARYLF